jgi:hypothetical protein
VEIVFVEVMHAPGKRNHSNPRVAQHQQGPAELSRPAVVQNVMPPRALDQFRDDNGYLPLGMFFLEEFDEAVDWSDKVPIPRVNYV